MKQRKRLDFLHLKPDLPSLDRDLERTTTSKKNKFEHQVIAFPSLSLDSPGHCVASIFVEASQEIIQSSHFKR